MRFTLLLTVCLLLAVVVHAAESTYIRAPKDTPAYKLVSPDDAGPANASFIQAKPMHPRRDDILGDQLEAGNTWYDYQSNGSTGKMIAVDNLGGVHITWMDGYSNENGGTRHQKYNFLMDDQWIDEDGVPASPGDRSGYGCITLSREEEQRAVIFCHTTGIIDADPTTLVLIDFGPGFGAFQQYQTPVYPTARAIWPQGVISPAGMIQVLMNRDDAEMLSFSGTEWHDGDPQFPEDLIEVSPMSLNTYRIAQSPNSERAAVTWVSSRTGIPAPPEWDGFLAYQMNNDLWLAWTDDGVNWNFDDPLNVTNVIPPNPDLLEMGDTLGAYGDTLRPFTTHDVIFDANDRIHIVFEARGLWEKPVYDPDVDRPPVDGLTLDASILFHWTEEDCTFTPVADGWFSQQIRDENDSLLIWPQPGAWKSNVCAPSLAYAPDGDLYCVFNYYPYNDYNDYVDGTGRVNGDIAVTVSRDNGQTWYHPTMIVETHSLLAQAGEAMCEEYPTLAEKIDDNLHISYILDHEAGSVIQDDNASNTLNEVYYLKVPLNLINRDSIVTRPFFHSGDELAAGIDDQALPSEFGLTGTYPNPFNSMATVEFNLDRTRNIEVAAYTTDGRLAANIFTGSSLPGHHRVSFNGEGLPTGVYLVKLSGDGLTSTLKVALIK